MIKVDIFSGRVYTETENFKQSSTGETFIKCGDTWFGHNGQMIQQRSDDLLNINTGISSKFGDPFEEQK
jgi:hypothetical protein